MMKILFCLAALLVSHWIHANPVCNERSIDTFLLIQKIDSVILNDSKIFNDKSFYSNIVSPDLSNVKISYFGYKKRKFLYVSIKVLQTRGPIIGSMDLKTSINKEYEPIFSVILEQSYNIFRVKGFKQNDDRLIRKRFYIDYNKLLKLNKKYSLSENT